MGKGIYCQIKNLEILVIRLMFNTQNSKLRTPTITQVRIMDYILNHAGHEVYQKDLERALNLRRATVSEVLATMEKKGLLTRQQNPNDARSKKIILSELDENEYHKIKESVIELEDILTANISEEELLTFSLTLKKMEENLKTNIINKEV